MHDIKFIKENSKLFDESLTYEVGLGIEIILRDFYGHLNFLYYE